LSIGKGDIGEYIQKKRVLRKYSNCKCCEFGAIQHIFNLCQKAALRRETLFGVSLDLDFV